MVFFHHKKSKLKTFKLRKYDAIKFIFDFLKIELFLGLRADHDIDVDNFLATQQWKPTLKKEELRKELRKHMQKVAHYYQSMFSLELS